MNLYNVILNTFLSMKCEQPVVLFSSSCTAVFSRECPLIFFKRKRENCFHNRTDFSWATSFSCYLSKAAL